jgi:hypothetical protein
MLPSLYAILIVGFQAAAFTAPVISTVDIAIVESVVVDELAHAEIARVDPTRQRMILESKKFGLLFNVILLDGVLFSDYNLPR